MNQQERREGSLISPVKFSFIIPAYAHYTADYLTVARALDSVLNQTDAAWEIILVHDGENPRMYELFTELRLKYRDKIRYLESPFVGARGGHASVESAKHLISPLSEYTTILNGDNTLRETYIEEMYSPDHDIIMCQVLMNDMPGIIFSGMCFRKGSIDRLNYAIRSRIFTHVRHGMELAADHTFLMDCYEEISKTHRPRVRHVHKVLAEHN